MEETGLICPSCGSEKVFRFEQYDGSVFRCKSDGCGFSSSSKISLVAHSKALSFVRLFFPSFNLTKG